ncbi:hypothetical protein RFM71_004501 [Vibrio parahaemolyticus]|nr:hypothetical protein [Vibrio parahaemolyticus]
MLTDIFLDRYVSNNLWDDYQEASVRFLCQATKMINEQIYPYWVDGKCSEHSKARLTEIHKNLSMELGVVELAPVFYSYQVMQNGVVHTNSGKWTIDKVCKDFMLQPFSETTDSFDAFMKKRISFIELAFRFRESEVKSIEAKMHQPSSESLDALIKFSSNQSNTLREYQRKICTHFHDCVDELNERLRRSGIPLHYHNGFVQIASDEIIERHIESSFWGVLKGECWKNVDFDMKEALDLRDSGGRDPAFYAAKALESTIKIISDVKGWTHGKEKGAHNYIDNLQSKKNGSFINAWEAEMIKSFFSSVRNPFGHGAGSDDMPSLIKQQTDWAIEACMSWIKTLVRRM